MTERLKFAVVGCGAIATGCHLPAIRGSAHARLLGVVDVDEAWARAMAERFGAAYAGADWLPLVGQIDAAVVATPNAMHAGAVEGLLRSGVHVLCEKPLAPEASEARRLFGLADSLGVRLMAAHSRRFSSHLALLRTLVRSGYVAQDGELTASLGGSPSNNPSRTDFRSHLATAGGGAMVDSGVHLIDLALSVFGAAPDRSDYWESFSDLAEVEDDAELTLHFPAGGCAKLAVSSSHDLSGSVTYRSARGWLSTTVNGPSAEFYVPASRICREAGVLQHQSGTAGAFEAQLEHFCACIGEGQPFCVTPAQVILGLELIEGCYAQRREEGGPDGGS